MVACLVKLFTLVGSDGEDEIGDFVFDEEEGGWRNCCLG